jgi:hypothetical protein
VGEKGYSSHKTITQGRSQETGGAPSIIFPPKENLPDEKNKIIAYITDKYNGSRIILTLYSWSRAASMAVLFIMRVALCRFYYFWDGFIGCILTILTFGLYNEIFNFA